MVEYESLIMHIQWLFIAFRDSVLVTHFHFTILQFKTMIKCVWGCPWKELKCR